MNAMGAAAMANEDSPSRAHVRASFESAQPVELARSLRSWAVVVVLGGLLFATASAETLTLATYNVENYGPANRVTDTGFHPNYPKPEGEKTALRAVIRGLGADVIVLQEMGPAPYLEELRRDLRDEGCDYPYSALAVAADPDRHVALLSKRPLLSSSTLELRFSYLGGIERVKRGVLQVTIATSAGELTLFGVHLKSRLTERADDPESMIRREAEATAVRDAVLKRFPRPAEDRFVILGDCNDTKISKTLIHLQRRGQTPVCVLVPAVDGRGETWTYSYRREDSYARIDHVLISLALVDDVVDGAANIFDGNGVVIASDHRPVLVRLRFGDKR